MVLGPGEMNWNIVSCNASVFIELLHAHFFTHNDWVETSLHFIKKKDGWSCCPCNGFRSCVEWFGMLHRSVYAGLSKGFRIQLTQWRGPIDMCDTSSTIHFCFVFLCLRCCVICFVSLRTWWWGYPYCIGVPSLGNTTIIKACYIGPTSLLLSFLSFSSGVQTTSTTLQTNFSLLLSPERWR